MIQRVGQNSEFDEAALVAQAQQGGVEAFTELVNRYEKSIFRLARHITQNPEDAEDVLQETFMKAYEHLVDFQGQFEVLHLAGAYRRQPVLDEAPEAEDGCLGFPRRAL